MSDLVKGLDANNIRGLPNDCQRILVATAWVVLLAILEVKVDKEYSLLGPRLGGDECRLRVLKNSPSHLVGEIPLCTLQCLSSPVFTLL